MLRYVPISSNCYAQIRIFGCYINEMVPATAIASITMLFGTLLLSTETFCY
jgi:hypothetical protein